MGTGALRRWERHEQWRVRLWPKTTVRGDKGKNIETSTLYVSSLTITERCCANQNYLVVSWFAASFPLMGDLCVIFPTTPDEGG